MDSERTREVGSVMKARVPDTLEEALSPQWLTTALQPSFPGVAVREVIPGPIVDRVSTNARFTIVCDGRSPRGCRLGCA